MDEFITSLLYPDWNPVEELKQSEREEYVFGLGELLHGIESSNKTARNLLYILAKRLSVNISRNLWEDAQKGKAKKVQRTRLKGFHLWSLAPYFWWDFYRIASMSRINFDYPRALNIINKNTNRFYRKYRIAAHNLFVCGDDGGILPTHLAEITLQHLDFANKTPRRLLVVGTMSSGKSTFINSIVGKKIVKVKITVCTTSVSKIYNRLQPNQIVYANEKECILTNDESLLSESYPKIALSFSGVISNFPVVFTDTPGVNYAYDATHRALTNKAMKDGDYDAIICVINTAYFESNETEDMIDMLPKNKKIIFVLNQLDRFSPDDDSIEETIHNFKTIIKEKKIMADVAPYSAKTGFLLKKESLGSNMSKIEKNELNVLKEQMNDSFFDFGMYATGSPTRENDYYSKSGLTYIEKLIVNDEDSKN